MASPESPAGMHHGHDPQVWIGLVGALAAPDCEILDDAPGAYVNMLVWASSEREFMRSVSCACEDYRLRAFEFRDVEPFGKRSAEHQTSAEIRRLADEARRTEGIRFGTFHMWTSDD